MNNNKTKLFKSIALPLLVGTIAGLLTRNDTILFQSLNQPPLSPPGIVFPIVWTILYTLMGISFYLVSKQAKDTAQLANAAFLYYFQLLLNFIWPFLFFHFQWFLLSFFWIIALWLVVFFMIKEFSNISKAAAYLNIPYLIWLTFAAYLNLGVWWLNR